MNNVMNYKPLKLKKGHTQNKSNYVSKNPEIFKVCHFMDCEILKISQSRYGIISGTITIQNGAFSMHRNYSIVRNQIFLEP